MTCIVGLVDGKDVWIGGDSAGVSGWDLTVRADHKVFNKGEFVFGFTSSFRMGQLIRYKFPVPEIKGDDLMEYMATSFIDALRQSLKDGGYAKKENEVEHGGNFLVGIKGRLFQVFSDYQVGEPRDGMDACGCGDQIARGALYALSKINIAISPQDKITLSLQAAERLSAGVRGPFVICKTT